MHRPPSKCFDLNLLILIKISIKKKLIPLEGARTFSTDLADEAISIIGIMAFDVNYISEALKKSKGKKVVKRSRLTMEGN